MSNRVLEKVDYFNNIFEEVQKDKDENIIANFDYYYEISFLLTDKRMKLIGTDFLAREFLETEENFKASAFNDALCISTENKMLLISDNVITFVNMDLDNPEEQIIYDKYVYKDDSISRLKAGMLYEDLINGKIVYETSISEDGTYFEGEPEKEISISIEGTQNIYSIYKLFKEMEENIQL